MNLDDDQSKCAHEYCSCMLNTGEGVMVDGRLYCGSECARGIGCSHEGCECADSD